ncbi:DNA-binding transcriptional regulator BolA-like [Anneissia japonica]|uniref:DNA-binding transcriptional regulator BolA-like n=1 Tax=Anneissia japonica TaxID=1529436 RepID=UPI0014259776|nr:DNA-binding transcriptional regulator BolA-like [Anneissia japonica]
MQTSTRLLIRRATRVVLTSHHSAQLSTTVRQGVVEKSIVNKLTNHFQPSVLDVFNESYMHNVPHGSETHFKVVIVSQKFHDEKLVQRHRLVNETLRDELNAGVHALSIQAFTPEQWDNEGFVSDSPKCLGGKARELKREMDRSKES